MDKITTIIANADDADTFCTASHILRTGGLVAFPTETVYGLGADAFNPDAAAKIYAAKGRPSDNPLIVHIADTTAVHKLANHVPDKAVILMEAFWPGPLTIILPKKDIVPDGTTGGLQTVAIRMPSHPAALRMIKESGINVAAPSANTSGRPSPTTAAHVAEDMTGKIDMIIDGGPVGIGIESTIVDLTRDVPTILRPGFITKKMLEAIVGEVAIDPALHAPNQNIRPKAPGMKYTHYAPNGELNIVEAGENSDLTDYMSVKRVADKINALVREKSNQGHKTIVITTEEHKELYDCENILLIGSETNTETIAAKLYAVLRKCDELGAEYIYTESFHQGELGGAIMNRLIKAAGHRVIRC